MKQKGISVCIITKNEERNLPDCLRSVAGIATEIIVGDTGSTDSTKKIARDFGCRVVDVEWRDDFAYARNETLKHANCSIVLIIDADERLQNPEAALELPGIDNPGIGGWIASVLSHASREDGSVDWHSAGVLRIFRNLPHVKFEGVVHEQVTASLVNTGYKLQPCDVRLIHSGYDVKGAAFDAKQARNLKLLNVALERTPGDAYLLYQRGRTHMALKREREAIADLKAAIEATPKGHFSLPGLLNHLSLIYFTGGEVPRALECVEISIAQNPEQAYANFLRAEILIGLNKFREGLAALDESFRRENSMNVQSLIMGETRIPEGKKLFLRGRAHLELKEFPEAFAAFTEAVKLNPRDADSMTGLAVLAFNVGKFLDAKNLIEEAVKLAPGREDILKYKKLIDDKLGISERKRTVTLSMIVKNEEKMLPGCLESVKGFVDEIVIVDTGSTDGTIKIAESYGAKVYRDEWRNDFAAARNESLKRATGEWVLYLDADERLLNAGLVQGAISRVDDNVGGIVCTIESKHFKLDADPEMHRGGYPRLFRNLGYPKVEFRGRVHEQISPSFVEKGYVMVDSPLLIEHLGYDRSREEMEQKIKRNYALLLDHVREEPLNGYAWFQLGQTLGHMHLAEQAEQTIKFAIGCGNLSDSVYASAAATLAQFAGNAKRFDEALDWADRSIEKAPNQIYSRNLRAHALLYLERYQEAEKEFEEVMKLMDRHRTTPTAGYDVEISPEIVERGIRMAKAKSMGND
ncbi:MAG: glycosyltransferase [Chloroflexota bacterium]